MRLPQKYTWSAQFYDLISFERPVYRAGRVAAIELLGLRPGDHVIDIGCGTGLNFPLLHRKIGPTGSITGIDRSAQMLAQAERRGGNHTLVCADATILAVTDPSVTGPAVTGPAVTGLSADAVIATYSLSLMDDPAAAVASMLRMAPRVAIVDMARPEGAVRVLEPVARLACALGGADIDAHPWTLAEPHLIDVQRTTLCGGHIHVVVGTSTGAV